MSGWEEQAHSRLDLHLRNSLMLTATVFGQARSQADPRRCASPVLYLSFSCNILEVFISVRCLVM